MGGGGQLFHFFTVSRVMNRSLKHTCTRFTHVIAGTGDGRITGGGGVSQVLRVVLLTCIFRCM